MTPTPPEAAEAAAPTRWLRRLDAILRGNYTSEAALLQGRVDVDARVLCRLGLLLGGIYGTSLGTYGLFHGGEQAWLQLLSTTVKLPLLFLLTLLVTFPSLYVFAALQRSPLGHLATLRLLLVAVVVNLAMLASLGPVFAFFTASTQSYAFLLLLNVLFCAASGFVSLVVLRRATNSLFAALPADRLRAGRRLLLVWCGVYGSVGAQMGWLLRPFLGAPGQPFQLLRGQESSFFEAVLGTLRRLFLE